MADEQNSGAQPGASEQNSANGGQQVVLQKIYLKDLSFESPKAPEVFTTNVAPQTQLNLRYANKDLGQDNVEVALTVTIEAKQDDATLFLVEMTQAGVFTIRGYTPEQRSNIVGTFCPTALYPFAREAIAPSQTAMSLERRPASRYPGDASSTASNARLASCHCPLPRYARPSR